MKYLKLSIMALALGLFTVSCEEAADEDADGTVETTEMEAETAPVVENPPPPAEPIDPDVDIDLPNPPNPPNPPAPPTPPPPPGT